MKATNYSKMATAAALLGLMLLSASSLRAQAVSAGPSNYEDYRTDAAFSYTAEHANPVGGGTFWLQGGSAEVGRTFWRGLGIAGNFTVTHTASVDSQNVSLGLMTYTLGPRYRWKLPVDLRGKATSIFAEALVGGVKGFDSVFPGSTKSTGNAYSLAVQAGAGIDVRLKKHISLRPIEVSWIRMQLPNSAANTQNDLRLSAGIVLHY